MKMVSKVVRQGIWWNHMTMGRWGVCMGVVLPTQGSRRRGESIGRRLRLRRKKVDNRVLCRILHSRRWNVRNTLPAPPRLATTTSPPAPRSGVLFIQFFVHFIESMVGVAGARFVFRIVYVVRRSVRVVNGTSFLLIFGGAPRCRWQR